MGRRKAFDDDQVLDRALDVFWRNGYEATSMQDLVDHMGINRASLYNTFGDKHSLYVAAIQRYQRQQLSRQINTLRTADAPLEAIEALLMEAATGACQAENHRRGCFLTNVAIERAAMDADAEGCVSGGLCGLEAAFEAALERAQAQGGLAPDRSPRKVARFLISSLQGLQVMGKAMPDAERLRDIVDETMQALR